MCELCVICVSWKVKGWAFRLSTSSYIRVGPEFKFYCRHAAVLHLGRLYCLEFLRRFLGVDLYPCFHPENQGVGLPLALLFLACGNR